MGDSRPSVVTPGKDAVDLVATLRTVFAHPHLAGGRIERSALRVAMAEAPDAGDGARLREDGIVRWNGAVRADPHYLALRRPQVLRPLLLAALAEGDEEVAFTIEDEA